MQYVRFVCSTVRLPEARFRRIKMKSELCECVRMRRYCVLACSGAENAMTIRNIRFESSRKFQLTGSL